MLAGKEPCRAAGFVIEDEVDPALAPQMHILGAVRGDVGKAHRFENRFHHALFRGAEFDEFEAVEADGVFEEIGHCNPLHLRLVSMETSYASRRVESRNEPACATRSFVGATSGSRLRELACARRLTVIL